MLVRLFSLTLSNLEARSTAPTARSQPGKPYLRLHLVLGLLSDGQVARREGLFFILPAPHCANRFVTQVDLLTDRLPATIQKAQSQLYFPKFHGLELYVRQGARIFGLCLGNFLLVNHSWFSF